MRKISILLILTLLLSLLASVAIAAPSEVKVYTDGLELQFDSNSGSPYIDNNNRTMLPVRKVSEATKAKVDWVGEQRKVVVSNDNANIEMVVGKRDYTINKVKKTMDAEVVLNASEGRTYAPFRAIVEGLGYVADYKDLGDKRIMLIFSFTQGQSAEEIKKIMDKIEAEVTGDTDVKTERGLTVEGMDNLRKLYEYDGRFLGETMIGREFGSIFTIEGKNASWNCVSHPELNTWKANDMTSMTTNGFTLMGGGYSIVIEKGMVIDYKVTPEKGSPFDVRIRL